MNQTMKKNTEIQALRAIGMMLILIGHMPISTSQYIIHSYTYVSLFLVISGYFSAKSICGKYDETVKASAILRKELVSRAFRLLPLMWIWILIYFLIGNCTIYMCGGVYGDWNRWKLELFHALIGDYNYYLAGLNIGGLFGQFWTLFVEIHFAILFIVLFSFVRNRRFRVLVCILMIFLTIGILRPMTPAGEVRYVTHAHLDSLFLGALIGMIDEDKKLKDVFQIRIPHRVKSLISVGICTLLLMSGYWFDMHFNNMNVKYFVYTVLSGVILVLAREREGWFSFGTIADKILAWIGDSSASTYVAHVILYSCVYYNIYYNTSLIPELIKVSWWGIALQVILLEIVAIIIGWVSLKLIENPYKLFAEKCSSRIR
jgi:peptidoglycan/LPS O-acetylase OafA/YrhL